MNTGFQKTYYTSRPGQIYEEWFEVGGIREGVYRKYNASGYINMCCHYVRGKRTGEFSMYYEPDGIAIMPEEGKNHGPLFVHGYLVDDKKNGPHRTFYINGKVKQLAVYKDNVLEGPMQLFTPEGEPKAYDRVVPMMRPATL